MACLQIEGGAVGRLLEAEPFDQRLKRSRSSAMSMLIDAGADDRRAGRFQAAGQVQRRLAAELHDQALRLASRSQMFSTSSVVSGSKKR